jgi:hypothetical protein
VCWGWLLTQTPSLDLSGVLGLAIGPNTLLLLFDPVSPLISIVSHFAYYLQMWFHNIPRHSMQRTPQSAARQNERDGRQLDSPVHRRTPQHRDINQPPIVPLAFALDMMPAPPFQGDDPFVLPPPLPPPSASPTAARLALDQLRAQAAAANALLAPVQRWRGRQQQRATAVHNPFPARTPAPSPPRLAPVQHLNPQVLFLLPVF